MLKVVASILLMADSLNEMLSNGCRVSCLVTFHSFVNRIGLTSSTEMPNEGNPFWQRAVAVKEVGSMCTHLLSLVAAG